MPPSRREAAMVRMMMMMMMMSPPCSKPCPVTSWPEELHSSTCNISDVHVHVVSAVYTCISNTDYTVLLNVRCTSYMRKQVIGHVGLYVFCVWSGKVRAKALHYMHLVIEVLYVNTRYSTCACTCSLLIT